MTGRLVPFTWLHAKSEETYPHILPVWKGGPGHLMGRQTGRRSSMNPSLSDQVSMWSATQLPSSLPSVSFGSLRARLGSREAVLRSFIHLTFIEHLLNCRPWEHNGAHPEGVSVLVGKTQ